LNPPAPLLHVAEALLRDGVPPPAHGGWTTGIEALPVCTIWPDLEKRVDALNFAPGLRPSVDLAIHHEQLEQSRAKLPKPWSAMSIAFGGGGGSPPPPGWDTSPSSRRRIVKETWPARCYAVRPRRLAAVPSSTSLQPIIAPPCVRCSIGCARTAPEPCAVYAEQSVAAAPAQVLGKAAPRMRISLCDVHIHSAKTRRQIAAGVATSDRYQLPLLALDPGPFTASTAARVKRAHSGSLILTRWHFGQPQSFRHCAGDDAHRRNRCFGRHPPRPGGPGQFLAHVSAAQCLAYI